MICENFWGFFLGFSLRKGGRINGMCCLGDSDDPGIRICIGEEGGMNDSGSRSETSEDKGVTNTQTHHSNSSSLPRASCHSFEPVYWNYSKSAKYRLQEQGTPSRQTWEGWKGLYTLNGQ